MRSKTILPFVIALVISIWLSARAGEAPKAANAEAETNAEAKAKAAYDAAEKAAKEAEAAVVPLRAAMQKTDTAYANAKKVADTKRQQATDAKNLAGEVGASELTQAEASVSAAVQGLTDATNAKPAAEKALADARVAALPLREAYDAAEKAAKEAEAVAKAASDAANKLDLEAKRATVQAVIKRKEVDAARTALPQVQRNEQQAAAQADIAAQKLAEAEREKKAADDALANAKNQSAAASRAYQAAEQAAKAAEASAKTISKNAAKSPEEKKKAADEAAAKRKAADAAKTSLAQAPQNEKQAQSRASAAAKKLTEAGGIKKATDEALASAKNRAAAAAASAAAGKEAEDLAKAAEEKELAAAQVAAKRKAVADAEAALAKAQQAEQQAQAQVNAAAKAQADAAAQNKSADAALVKAKDQVAAATTASAEAEKAAQEAGAAAKQISADAAKPDAAKTQAAADAAAKRKAADAAAKRKAADAAKAALAQARQREQAAQAPAAAAARKSAEAGTQEKAADAALANAKNQVAATTAACQAPREAAGDLLSLDAASKEAADAAAVKRKAAGAARAALAPVERKLEQAAIQANNAGQRLAQAEARKKSGEEALENLKKRIAAAKPSYPADEQAAKEAEDAAAPLKAEADKARKAYAAAMQVADDQRALADQAKAALYRVLAARQVPSLMESSDPPKPANRIDEIVLAKLKALGIEPVLCSDAVFVRRAYLDVTGKLPSAEEAKVFIQSSDKNKRVALIDRLLERSEHVDYWAMKWSDILRVKAEFPVKVWPNAAQAYHRWVWESVAQNKRYDRFARELLTSSGSNFRVGPVNFYRAIQDKTPEGIAAAVGLALMGTRIHLWPEDRRAGMTVFFSQVGYKPTSEWKEEIVFWDPLNSVAVPGSTAPGIDSIPKSVTATNAIPQALAKPLSQNGPLAAVFPDGTKTTVPPDRDPREVFADWLIRPENPWFTKAIADRTWAWVMGRGIIDEPDDIRQDNPPSNPELLDYLQRELLSSGYDLKHLKRLIFTSTTYQFSSVPRFKRPQARANFASYPLRRVEAEVLIDALNNIAGSSDLYTSAVPEPFTYVPSDMSAVELADGSVTSSFLTLFGRSARATGMESERVNELASSQWLHMLNSVAVQDKLQNGPKLRAMLSSGGNAKEIAERLYLTILSRFPTDADLKAVEEYAKAKGGVAWIDLAWALINSPEFLLRH
ncbi:MAG: DUF1553 domain-containing protein [Thermoguttaceae bacterium]|jgi:hypothetical protein